MKYATFYQKYNKIHANAHTTRNGLEPSQR